MKVHITGWINRHILSRNSHPQKKSLSLKQHFHLLGWMETHPWSLVPEIIRFSPYTPSFRAKWSTRGITPTLDLQSLECHHGWCWSPILRCYEGYGATIFERWGLGRINRRSWSRSTASFHQVHRATYPGSTRLPQSLHTMLPPNVSASVQVVFHKIDSISSINNSWVQQNLESLFLIYIGAMHRIWSSESP